MFEKQVSCYDSKGVMNSVANIKYAESKNFAQLTIDSPPANALSSSIIQEIDEFLDDIESNPKMKAVIIHGEGRFFSTGADIKEFTDINEPMQFSELSEKGQKVFERIEKFHVPVIAAIHGAALGGGLELAMSCHMRIVAKNAQIGLPELTLGLIPGFAGTQRLPQLVGAPKAMEMMLTAEAITGKEAAQLGLANKAVAEEEVLEQAKGIATKIAEKSKPTIEKIMELVNYAKTGQYSEGAKQEADAFGMLFGTEDAKEGISAFLEKRKPKFKDK